MNLLRNLRCCARTCTSVAMWHNISEKYSSSKIFCQSIFNYSSFFFSLTCAFRHTFDDANFNRNIWLAWRTMRTGTSVSIVVSKNSAGLMNTTKLNQMILNQMGIRFSSWPSDIFYHYSMYCCWCCWLRRQKNPLRNCW